MSRPKRDKGVLMNLKLLPETFTVCKVEDESQLNSPEPIALWGKTEDEISWFVPLPTFPVLLEAREDGWRCFKIEGELDFSMIGVISHLSSILVAEDLPPFVISTFQTDYIFCERGRSFQSSFLCWRKKITRSRKNFNQIQKPAQCGVF